MEDIPKPTNKSVGWVAATCQMVMQYQGLALMCRELGQTQKVARNEVEAKAIAERVKSNEGYTSLNLKDGPTADQSCYSKCLRRTGFRPLKPTQTNNAMTQSEVTKSTVVQKKERLMSIDALRGFDMFWITGGASVVIALAKWFGGPLDWLGAQFEHVDWEGMHFEDLIMPLFMFTAGVSLPLSVESRLAKNSSKMTLWGHIIKRFVLLWIFGMAVQGNLLSWNPDEWKYYSNTLQAIAAGYLIAMLLYLCCSVRAQWIISVGLLLVTWSVFATVAAPGGMTGDYSPDGNVGMWIDNFILRSHQDGSSYVWILPSLNFGVTTMIGVFAGRCLRHQCMTGSGKTLWLVGAGVMAIGVAFAWAPFHPIIKHLWTGSFVLLSGGMSLLLLALFYWIIDVRGWRKWSYFFVVIGANAIAAYLLAQVWNIGGVLSDPVFGRIGDWLPDDPAEFIRAVANVGALWLILWHLYRRGIFFKV